MFSIGQWVVCIAPHHEWERCGVKVPKVGCVYTVRGIDDTDGLLLEEIVNEGWRALIDMASGAIVEPGEDSFWQCRFRAVRRETDISIFRKALESADGFCVVRRIAVNIAKAAGAGAD